VAAAVAGVASTTAAARARRLPDDAGVSLPDNRLRGPLARQLALDHGDWQPLLQAWGDSAAGRTTLASVEARLAAGATVYPAQPLRALAETPLAAVRVVILGQDPYHGPGQAEGLAFSVPPGVPPPPSLRNILAELQRDGGLSPHPRAGSLVEWARQGVLLLNTVLTVEQGAPASHARIGWQVLTDLMVDQVISQPLPVAFLLWGAHAQTVAPKVEAAGRHLVLKANHPSPLAARRPPRPFIGCGHFGQANAFLQAAGRGGVDWSLQSAPDGWLSGDHMLYSQALRRGARVAKGGRL
jgi:uracil-DNA glycosylase